MSQNLHTVEKMGKDHDMLALRVMTCTLSVSVAVAVAVTELGIT